MATRRGDGVTPTVLTGAQILCYGDSLTAGYCSPSFVPYAATLAESIGRPVDHAGMCGWSTLQMIRHADSEVDEAFGLRYPGLRRLVRDGQYSVAILMAGTNDLGCGGPADYIADNLRRMHRICHDAGVRTVAVSVPQSEFSSDNAPAGRFSLRSKQKEVNSLLREFAESDDAEQRCVYVDMESRVPWSVGSADWMSDGLHMSKAGNEKFGRLLGPLVRDFVETAVQKA